MKIGKITCFGILYIIALIPKQKRSIEMCLYGQVQNTSSFVKICHGIGFLAEHIECPYL